MGLNQNNMTTKWLTFIVAVFFLVSCQKGGEPVPFSKSSTTISGENDGAENVSDRDGIVIDQNAIDVVGGGSGGNGTKNGRGSSVVGGGSGNGSGSGGNGTKNGRGSSVVGGGSGKGSGSGGNGTKNGRF